MSNFTKCPLHIVSMDVPFPANYGGIIDVFYKIKALNELGFDLYLHCFEYGRTEQEELNKYCRKVFYYKRKTGLAGLSLKWPYMLYSRRDKMLLNNLISLDAPILFEGVHTIFYLNDINLKNRIKILRNQNLEQEYFRLLGYRSSSWWKKLYYYIESKLLRKVENDLQEIDLFMTVAKHEYDFFKKLYPHHNHEYIPSFHPYNDLTIPKGKGDYILYHGNLGHPENKEAALFLIEKIVPFVEHPFIFAGKDPDKSLIKLVRQHKHVSLIINPDDKKMDELIEKAQIHVLPTFQPTGLKLKLLLSLFRGRHVLVNQHMLKGTGLDQSCLLAESPEEFINIIKEKFMEELKTSDFENRKKLLLKLYNNKENALRIKEAITSIDKN